MKKQTISTIFGVAFALFLSILFANAAQNFAVSPTSLSDTTILTQADSSTFTITNSGNVSINLTISKVNLVRGSETVTLVLNTTSITNLAVSGTQTVKVSYTPNGVSKGTYVGSVTVVNAQNSSQTITIPVTLNVIGNGEALELVSFANDKILMSGELDDTDTKTIKFRNSGNVTLTNIQFTVTDLEGDSSSDQIDKEDIDLNDDGFTLLKGESDRIEIRADIPRNIEIDTYVGTLTARSSEGYEFKYELEVTVTGGDLSVVINDRYNVANGVMKVIAKAGEVVNNYEFEIENDGNINVNNINFELDGDLVEEFTSNTIAKSEVTFSPSLVDLQENDNEIVELSFYLPEGTSSGTYSAEVRAVSQSGKIYDSFRLELKIVGDIYIKTIEMDNEVTPGDNLDVQITVRNQGSKVERNLKITGTLFDIDYGNSDIIEATSSFLLDVGAEKTETLRFKIPQEASDGSHTLELRLSYGSETLVEVEEVIVTRPTHKITFESIGINPGVAKCDDSLYTFVKVKNLGKFDEDVKFTTEIIGTGIKEESSMFTLDVDEAYQNNQILNIKGLEAGTYTVSHKVNYNTNLFVKEESELRVSACGTGTIGGIDVKPIVDVINQTNTTKISLFGTEMEKGTVYLGGGIAGVFVLILISLFFL